MRRVGFTGFHYFEFGRSRFWPDLGTQIQPEPDPDFGENLRFDHTTIRRMNLMASLMLSAAIKRQDSSVCHLLSLFDSF